jgi:hypothetical protein
MSAAEHPCRAASASTSSHGNRARLSWRRSARSRRSRRRCSEGLDMVSTLSGSQPRPPDAGWCVFERAGPRGWRVLRGIPRRPCSGEMPRWKAYGHPSWLSSPVADSGRSNGDCDEWLANDGEPGGAEMSNSTSRRSRATHRGQWTIVRNRDRRGILRPQRGLWRYAVAIAASDVESVVTSLGS